jgi:AraC-like DNA-binding protein
LPAHTLLAAARVDPRLLDDDRARIPRDADTALWHAIQQTLGEDAFGIRFVEQVEADAFGPVGLLAMSSPTVGEAIERGVRYHHLIKDDVIVSMRRDGGALVVDQALPPGHRPWTRPIADYAMGTYVALARRWTGAHVRPREVHFTHARPAQTGEYERFFGCPVTFGARTTGLSFDDDVLSLPLVTARPEFEAFFTRLVEESTALLERRDFAHEVRHAVARELQAGDVSLERVARRVGTSTRSLQRHLESRGVTFQSVVDEVRRAMALDLLASTDLRVDVIGERLGYAEAASFRRAFRRWTGVPPVVMRRKLASQRR